jgi:hypothetical protein
MRPSSRRRRRRHRGERILLVDHHAGIKGQELKPKQPRDYEGADNQPPLQSRPTPYTFPGPEELSGRKSVPSGIRRKFDFLM